MIWKILRPYYWILDRKVRSTNQLIVVGLLLLLGVGGQWIYDNLIRDNLALLNSEQVETMIASFLPLGFFLVLLFAMLGVGDMTHQLYLASDLELLMIAPVPFRTIFLVKLMQCSRATLIPAIGVGTFLLVVGLASDAAVSYYLLVVSLMLAMMVLATAMVMMLVILLARFLPAQKTRSWMPLAVVLATFVLMLGQQSGTQWLQSQTGLIALLAEAPRNPGQLGLIVAGIGCLSVLTNIAAYRIFDTTFHEGWNRFREVPTRQSPVSLFIRRRWRLSRWVKPLPIPLRFILVKEWLELIRNPRGIISLAQPLVLVVAVLFPFITAGELFEILRPIIFWYILALLLLSLSTLPLGMPLEALAQEGRKIALLRSAPVSMSDVLKGKFWATWVSLVLPWVLVFLFAGLGLGFPRWQVGFLVFMTIWGLAGTSAATMAICGLKVDFSVEELKRRISMVTSFFMMGLNAIFVLLTIATSIWFMVRLLPDSRAALEIQILAGYPAFGWIYSDNQWIPLALASSQVVFWVGVKLLWDAAVRRLERWEDS